MSTFLTGSLIISNPAIAQMPKFSHIAGKAIYIVQHSPVGAVGISLNQNFSMPIDEIAKQQPKLSHIKTEELLFPKFISGGPLAGENPWILGRNQTEYNSQIMIGKLSLNLSEQAFKDNKPEYFSACGVGTFGWGAGQLENEMANLLWHYFPVSEEVSAAIPFDQEHRGAMNLLLEMLKH